jgi:8-oxo-dGTP pyrophosphatase MutT (NUDIX family)
MPADGVVCYIRDRGRVLLQLKAEGRFGGGYWNAPGGKLTDGESPVEAAVREVREETGLTVEDLRGHGTLRFHFGETAESDITVHVFSTERFAGTVTPNEEGRLEWIDEAALPYAQMWADDAIWLPHLLAGRRFDGTFWFSEDMRQLLSHELRVEG